MARKRSLNAYLIYCVQFVRFKSLSESRGFFLHVFKVDFLVVVVQSVMFFLQSPIHFNSKEEGPMDPC